MHLTSLDGLAGSRAEKSSTILVSFWIPVIFCYCVMNNMHLYSVVQLPAVVPVFLARVFILCVCVLYCVLLCECFRWPSVKQSSRVAPLLACIAVL